ncbi:TPA: hypothetical protein KKK91_002662 [Escherichia coli]|nr:hypothetical protein [Escherichia coli]HBD5160540.1 hypothetical protein [Escherichia coli]HBD5188325.1 hypothetical protein [Escherichia coli]HBD5196402.1 hypothetical protein [Escherichia coli]
MNTVTTMNTAKTASVSLVELGVLEEEQKATLNLPKPNNTILIQNKAAERLRQNVGSLEVFGL